MKFCSVEFERECFSTPTEDCSLETCNGKEPTIGYDSTTIHVSWRTKNRINDLRRDRNITSRRTGQNRIETQNDVIIRALNALDREE